MKTANAELLAQLPDEEQINVFASGVVYRRWKSGAPVDFSYVLDIGVAVGKTGDQRARVIARLANEGFGTFHDAKLAMESAGINGLKLDEPEFEGEPVDANGYEEVAGVEVNLGASEILCLMDSRQLENRIEPSPASKSSRHKRFPRRTHG